MGVFRHTCLDTALGQGRRRESKVTAGTARMGGVDEWVPVANGVDGREMGVARQMLDDGA